MLTSTSCPTPLTTGAGERAIARATRLAVEGPQILERASAPHQQHHVDAGLSGERVQRRGDLELGALPLHPRGRDQDPRRGKAPRRDLEHVAQRRAGGGCDHADTRREARQRSLARGVEEALGFQPPAQLLEGELERTRPARLELAHDQLQIAARLVDGHVGVDDHLEPVLGLERAAAAPRCGRAPRAPGRARP